jgi:hypothetical protein
VDLVAAALKLLQAGDEREQVPRGAGGAPTGTPRAASICGVNHAVTARTTPSLVPKRRMIVCVPTPAARRRRRT